MCEVKPQRPYFIAELSANHRGNFETAAEIVKGVSKSGATAIKLQTFTADQMAVKSDKVRHEIPGTSQLWAGKDLWGLMKEAEMPLEWHRELFRLASGLGMDAFSTPYNPESVGMLVDLGASAMKISSFDIINHPLLREVSFAGLPIILSTGMATLIEVREAVEILSSEGATVSVLKCTSAYPCVIEDSNLLGIQTLKSEFGLEVGYSDHSLGSKAATIARVLGATIFEKHVKLSESETSLDSEFSLTPVEFAAYVRDVGEVSLFLGSGEIKPIRGESASLWERPSVIALRHIEVGEPLTESNVGVRRPSIGASPKLYLDLIGKLSNRTYEAGEGLAFE